MLRTEAAEFAKVVVAFAEGREVQFRGKNTTHKWITVPEDEGYHEFDTDIWEYRTKPQPFRCRLILRRDNTVMCTCGTSGDLKEYVDTEAGERVVNMVEEVSNDAI